MILLKLIGDERKLIKVWRGSLDTRIKTHRNIQKYLIYTAYFKYLSERSLRLKGYTRRFESWMYSNIEMRKKHLQKLYGNVQKNRSLENVILTKQKFTRIHFAYFQDSRGRVYSYSESHPITNKLLRSVIEKEGSYQTLTHLRVGNRPAADSYSKITASLNPESLISYIKAELGSGEAEKIASLALPVPNLGTLEFNLYVIVLIELGKLFKNELIVNKANPELGLGPEYLAAQGFITAVNFAERVKEFADVEDVAYASKVVYEIRRFSQTLKWNNFSINRDSTASAFQH